MRNISNIFVVLLAVLTVLIILSGSQTALSQSADSEAEPEEPVPFALPQSGPFTPADIKIGNDEAISNWFRSA
ncbi:MAG: hypothetical protein KJP02_00830, partial [Octadecabacter sp.]|nr:hypothetical protein [Octadecabacter sp.]